MPNFTVLARDRDLSNLGTIDGYVSLRLTPRFNAVGAWQLVYEAGSLGATLLAAGRGVRVFRAGATTGPPILSGPVTSIIETLDKDRGAPLITFTGVCDNVWLANRAALPDPATDASTYADAYDVRSGVAETVMKAYVNANAGPGALLRRRVVTLGPNLTRGPSVAYSARFESLLVLLQRLGLASGLGFQVQQLGAALVFDVYQPTDRSGYVRFSTDNGGLGGYGFTLNGPSATTVYVGDKGQDTGRSFTELTDASAETDWNMRVEAFVDSSSTTDVTQVTQNGQQALISGAPQVQATFTPRDTAQRRYGIDYGLGDTVTVKAAIGSVADVVREVAITDDTDNGVQIAPTVGGTNAADPSTTPDIYQRFRNLAVAVGFILRRR